jgi:hypothetical protein
MGLIICLLIGVVGVGWVWLQTLRAPALLMPSPKTAPIAPAPAPNVIIPAASVSRDAIQRQYESWGFTFVESTLRDGRARVVGTSDGGWVVIELIGSPDAATHASAMLMIAADPAQQQRNVAFITALLELMTPTWSDGASWLRANLDKMTSAIQGGERVDARELSNEQYTVSLHTHEMSGTTMMVAVVGAR